MRASRARPVLAGRSVGRAGGRRAFSLIEVLMAIFILGIGIISIAALFPAGIAQQRRSVDDVLGPVVANNAMAIIRAKVRREDFGVFEEFTGPGSGGTVDAPRPTIQGDWTWLRPAVHFDDDPDTPDVDERGAIDVFSYDWYASPPTLQATEFEDGYEDADNNAADPALFGIPFNTRLYSPLDPPRVLITQRERYYPMAPPLAVQERPDRPEYVWDCMFRRFQGRILVAVFVYRVTAVGGEGAVYTVQANPDPSNAMHPPLPIWLDLLDTQSGSEPWRGMGWEAPLDGSPAVPGTEEGMAFDPTDHAHQWQVGGQWLLDQNNAVHRVLAGRRTMDDGPVELSRPVSAVPPLPVYYYIVPSGFGGSGQNQVVTDIWYLPVTIASDEGDRELRLTPVYVTVQEL